MKCSLGISNFLKVKWKWSHSVMSDSLWPMNCSPPNFSVHGILQARILEWVAISFSRGSSWPRDLTQVSHIAGRHFNLWTTNLSLSIVFLYFFALIAEEGFLISPCSSLELCIQMGISFLLPLLFAFLLFTAICKASSDSHFSVLHFFFLGMVLVPASCTMSWTSVHSSSGTLSDLVP